jgi:hypothetical protein
MIVKSAPIAAVSLDTEAAVQPQMLSDARGPAFEIQVPNESEPEYTLPRDHPPWPHDSISLTTKARSFLARARPLVVAVLSFWDQRVRSIETALGRVTIDQSGSYRLS